MNKSCITQYILLPQLEVKTILSKNDFISWIEKRPEEALSNP
jgi:hypothetical protein